MEHEFSLLFRLPPGADDMRKIMDALLKAECTDALVGFGNIDKAELSLDFIREGESPEAARKSAINDVLRALPGAQLLEEHR
jgi:hypothetical protein